MPVISRFYGILVKMFFKPKELALDYGGVVDLNV